MPYKDSVVKCQKELERRKRKRAEDPLWAEHNRAMRRASAKRRRQRRGAEIDAVRKAKMASDPEYAARRRASKAAINRASNKRCRARKNAEWAAYHAAKLQRTPPWADLDAIKLVYLVAEQRTRLTGIEHHVDHFFPLNGETVSGLHTSLNLGVIPEDENLRKGNQLLAA
jgi:hypothetical protein